MGKDNELLEAARNGNVNVVEKIFNQKGKRSGPLARWVFRFCLFLIQTKKTKRGIEYRSKVYIEWYTLLMHNTKRNFQQRKKKNLSFVWHKSILPSFMYVIVCYRDLDNIVESYTTSD